MKQTLLALTLLLAGTTAPSYAQSRTDAVEEATQYIEALGTTNGAHTAYEQDGFQWIAHEDSIQVSAVHQDTTINKKYDNVVHVTDLGANGLVSECHIKDLKLNYLLELRDQSGTWNTRMHDLQRNTTIEQDYSPLHPDIIELTRQCNDAYERMLQMLPTPQNLATAVGKQTQENGIVKAGYSVAGVDIVRRSGGPHTEPMLELQIGKPYHSRTDTETYTSKLFDFGEDGTVNVCHLENALGKLGGDMGGASPTVELHAQENTINVIAYIRNEDGSRTTIGQPNISNREAKALLQGCQETYKEHLTTILQK